MTKQEILDRIDDLYEVIDQVENYEIFEEIGELEMELKNHE